METRSQAAVKRAADRDGDGCPRVVDQGEQQRQHDDDEKNSALQWCTHIISSLVSILICASVMQIAVYVFMSNGPMTF